MMKLLMLAFVLLQTLYLVKCNEEEDYFLKNLKNQFGDVPRDVKLFDFLQNENNLQGLLGLHNEMCEQLNNFNSLKANQRHRRDAETDTTVDSDTTPSVVNATVDVNTIADASPSETTSNPSRRRRDVSDSSVTTTNATTSANQTDDQQQNLNDQQPPADDQGDQQPPQGSEQQEAEIAAAGAAYFKQLLLNVMRYILNCLMTYINMFY